MHMQQLETQPDPTTQLTIKMNSGRSLGVSSFMIDTTVYYVKVTREGANNKYPYNSHRDGVINHLLTTMSFKQPLPWMYMPTVGFRQLSNW